MKTKLFALAAILQTCCSFAQTNSFAPEGATWYYSHGWFSGNNNEDYTKIDAIGDTTIEGRSCSIVFINNAYQNASDFPDSIFLFSDSGRVFRYFTEVSQWGLQYNFNADLGDTITLYGYFVSLDSFQVVVDAIGTININNHLLRTQYYRAVQTIWDDHQEVIEGIGGTIFLFPTYDLAENTNYGLRCYSDSVIGYYNTGLVATCDTLINSIGEVSSDNLTVFPTLFLNEVTIENHGSAISSLEIVNELATVSAKYSLEPFESMRINLQTLPEGIYFVIASSDDRYEVKKLLKISNN